MVCSADDLRGWRDFPKGLRVLLLDGDSISAAELKSKLEDMDYIVSTFCNENEALEAISSKAESFHVAIVEVSAGNSHGCFRFLETAKDLPTIMISNIHCLSTMMKCIALGAAEVLQKPLSEDKLRNIWQHVVHKAFNAGGSVLSKSLKPIKETVASIIQLQSETDTVNMENGSDTDNSDHAVAHDCERSLASDGYPAPSTPQLECGRLIDIGECQDQPNRLIKKESKDHVQESIELRQFFCSESKSVENTCTNSAGTVSLKVDSQSCPAAPITEEEVNSADGSKPVECNGTRESIVSSYSQNGGNVESCRSDDQKKASNHSNSCGTETNRKKMKVDWTPELHRRFVQAVEQLGIDQAIPSKILELMKVEGLTRHNVASHLQKYRMHRRHIMPKENERKWPVQRDPMQRGYMHKPIMAYPPYHYPVWGHPSWSTSGVQMWGPGFPTWQPTESWLCKTYPTMHADAWGCPVAPPYGLFPQNTRECHGFVENGMDALIKSFDLYPAEEAIDEAVQEVMSQPWLPLPLGLKPPSAESVMSELHMQGISKIPPSKPL